MGGRLDGRGGASSSELSSGGGALLGSGGGALLGSGGGALLGSGGVAALSKDSDEGGRSESPSGTAGGGSVGRLGSWSSSGGGEVGGGGAAAFGWLV